jgi:hypothetical protein
MWAKLIELIKAWLESRKDKPKPEPVQPEPVNPEPVQPVPSPLPDPSRPNAYRRGFLWKPVADGGRPLVVLIPAAFSHNTTKRMTLKEYNGEVEVSNRHGNLREDGKFPNGNREHYRFRRRGEQYRSPCEVSIQTTDGKTWTWRVDNVAGRNDGNITPTVS